MSPPGKTLPQLLGSIDNSLKAALKADPNSEKLHPNKEPREVFGQYVEVSPTPLPVRDPCCVPMLIASVGYLHLYRSCCRCAWSQPLASSRAVNAATACRTVRRSPTS